MAYGVQRLEGDAWGSLRRPGIFWAVGQPRRPCLYKRRANRASVYRHTSKFKDTPRWRQKNDPNSEYILVVRRDQRFQSSGSGTYPRASRKAPPATKGQLHGPVLYFITRTVLQRNVEEDALLAAALVLVPDLRLYEASTASMASRWRRVDGVSAAARRWRIGGSAAAARRWRRGEALTRGRKPRDRPDGVVAAPPPRCAVQWRRN